MIYFPWTLNPTNRKPHPMIKYQAPCLGVRHGVRVYGRNIEATRSTISNPTQAATAGSLGALAALAPELRVAQETNRGRRTGVYFVPFKEVTLGFYVGF